MCIVREDTDIPIHERSHKHDWRKKMSWLGASTCLSGLYMLLSNATARNMVKMTLAKHYSLPSQPGANHQ